MKKSISILSLLLLVFSSFTNLITFAQTKSTTRGKTTSTDFVTELSQGVFKVNFKDITKENAGVIQKTWTGEQNFPSKLLLPKGIALDLNQTNLDAHFAQTNLMKQKVDLLNDRNIDFGTFQISDPVINVLPDRLQIIKTTTIEYRTQNQLIMIRDFIQGDGKTQTSQTKEQLLAELNKKLPQINTKGVQNSIISSYSNQRLNSSQNKDMKNLGSDKIPLTIEQDVFEELQKECYLTYSPEDSRCSDNNFQNEVSNATKEITTEEVVSFSLIPPTPEQIRRGAGLLSQDPKMVRISLSEIENNFDEYGIVNQELVNIETDDTQGGNIVQENPFENENYCEEYHYGDQQKIDECNLLMDSKNNPQEKNYEQMLLNGFTIGKSDRYDFTKTLKINLLFKKIKIFKVGFGFYYSYGFGLRIPIKSNITVDKDIVDDWSAQTSRYNFKVVTSTFDAQPQDYITMGLPNDKVFDGNEFVFEFTAGFTYSIRALKLIDIEGNISLIELLSTVLGKNELKAALGLTEQQYIEMIAEKGINKSKNFTPPFDGANQVQLAKFGVPIPILDWAYFKLMGYLGTEVKLDGRINAKCNMVNSTGGCNGQRVELNRAGKNFNANAVYSSEASMTDSLGFYSKYGVVFDDYRYLPELVFRIFAKVGASAKIPLYGWYTIRTPEIDVYEFSISNDNLYLASHEGSISSVKATDQKVYSTRPNVTIITPTVAITTQQGVHNDRSELKLTNQVNNGSWYVYTLDGTTPDCRVSQRIVQNQAIKMWTNPTISPLISPKTIQYKVRGCSVIGDGSEMLQGTVMLRNDSLKFGYLGGPNSRDNYSISSRYSNDLKFFYTLDGSVPSMNNGTLYTQPFNFSEKASTTLQNDFDVNIKGVAYNKSNATFNQIMDSTYTIHNVYFNPIINVLPIGTFSVEAKSYDNDAFSTYISYTTDGSNVDCNTKSRIFIKGTNNQIAGNDMRVGTNYYLPNGHIPYESSPIKAITCVQNIQGNVVFSSDVVSKSPYDLDKWKTGKYDYLRDKLEDGSFAKEFMDSLKNGGLDGFLDQEGVMDFMRDTLGGLTDGGVREIFGMFGNGDLTVDGLRDLGSQLDMRNGLTQGQRLSSLQSGIQSNRFTQRGVTGIVRNIQNNKLSIEGLNNFGSMIQTFSNIPPAPSTFGNNPNSGEPSYETESFCRQSCTKFYGFDQSCYNLCISNLGGLEFDFGNNEDQQSGSGSQSEVATGSSTSSKDPYINGKLKEIDQCFAESYQSHLDNIDESIKKLTTDLLKLQKTDPKYSSYELAIEKLKELRKIFINKYGFLRGNLAIK